MIMSRPTVFDIFPVTLRGLGILSTRRMGDRMKFLVGANRCATRLSSACAHEFSLAE
jgi:hypothetical protein